MQYMYYYYVCGEISMNQCVVICFFYEANTPKTNIPLGIINQTKSSISVFFFSVSQANQVTHTTQKKKKKKSGTMT